MMPKFLRRGARKRDALAARDRANIANRQAAWMAAIPDYRSYLSWNPDDFSVWVQLGHMLAESGDYLAADRTYAIAEALAPNDADLFLCWGHLFRRMGDNDRARELYAHSAELDGNTAAVACLAELTPPVAPEPVAEPEQEQELEALPPPYVGKIVQIDGTSVLGWAFLGDAVELESIEFRHGSEVVGHTPLLHPLDRRSNFAAILDVAGERTISAYRRSDGVELYGSPFIVQGARQENDLALPAWSLPIETLKPFALPVDGDAHGEIALFVTHSATGILKPHVLPYLRALAAEGIAILLIVVVDHPIDLPDELDDLVKGIVVRANGGYDFAAWAHVLKLHPELYAATTLYFVNDSMFGPANSDDFRDLIARVRTSDADLIGLTESHEHGWHVQSYFFAARQRLIATIRFQAFFEDVKILGDKDAVIRAYEVQLAAVVRRIGFEVAVLFPITIAINPTLFAWRALLDAGFVFVKILLLRGSFPEADLFDWRERLAQAGFDLPLLDLTIRACKESLPQGTLPGLVARRRTPKASSAPLKVDFFGPWNYDSGLAVASRGLVAALRRTGVRLNLHPIRKPFHVHRPFTPPVDLIDFEGPADIALVHLNPDSWHLLTEDQIALIQKAEKRIGYWVWEMGHIPEAWWADWHSVDRIWSPSTYCAELFAAHSQTPVDVIPHAVPILPPVACDRRDVLADLGLAPADRIILYVFDGASYLVRKNPASLVRGFAASGLAQRGWKLVLKTKHLMDRPLDGENFRAFAEGVEGVVLIDRSMTPLALRALVQTADLYASTHCSEGFGLTIAEAMAAGRPVIATDFGGSRDFLDAASGYPVRAHPWTLEEDFNHYTLGGSWSRIDEPALAAILVEAADAVEAGDCSVGKAARDRIREQLSYDAVASRIIESLSATMATASSSAPVAVVDFPRFRTAIHAGLPLSRTEFGPRFTILPLAESGAALLDRLRSPAEFPADRDHWVIIAPGRAQLHPHLPRIVDDLARDRPDVGIFYGDDVVNDTVNAFDQIRLKPAFDLTLLAAHDYIGTPLIVRASAFATLDGLRAAAGTAASFDLVLRAHSAGLSVERIPEVLAAHPGDRIWASADDRRRVLAEQPFAAPYDIVPGRLDGSLMLRRRFDDDGKPKVTLIIPTRRSLHAGNGRTHLELLLDRIAETDWPMERLEVIIGDDIAGVPDWAKRDWPFRLQRIETLREAEEPFNYSRKMNVLWPLATNDLLVFMNDDVRPERPDWLAALMTFAVDEGVGGVGARLLYEDGRLQHAGIVPHLRAIAHAWFLRRPEQGSYLGWADLHREWSMVTGAVFATRRSVLSEVAGFDESFALEYNDVDLCLRIRALGYRLVVTPDAEMVHVEKASRGPGAPSGSELARFLARWRAWLAADPAWHPGLRTDTFDLLPKDDPGAWYRL